MSCGKNNKYLIEQYGDIHLHTGPYPLPANEGEVPECEGSCDYYGVQPKSTETPQLMAMNGNPDPKKRYAMVPSEPAEIGVGCMNLNCMCANCHGDCKCPPMKTESVDQQLHYNKEVAEHFTVGGFEIEDQTATYLLLALLIFIAWYFLAKQ